MLIPQSVYWAQHVESDDMTWTSVQPTIWGQITMNLAVPTACIPSLKGVIDMYLSGASMFTVQGQYTFSNNESAVNAFRSLLPGRFSRLKARSQTKEEGSNVFSHDTKNASHLRSKSWEESHTIPERSESQVSHREGNIFRTVEYEVYIDDLKPHPQEQSNWI